MVRQRSLVDYSLRRRAVLAGVRTGMSALSDVCDADVYLVRAARYHGEPTSRSCPVCGDESLTDVHYVFGDRLGRVAGQAHRLAELERLAEDFGSVTVYVVEVCGGCEWNHLLRSYVLEDERPDDGSARPRGTVRRVKV